MPVAAAVYVPEGIVLASDSRLVGLRTLGDGASERFVVSDNFQKVFWLEKIKAGIVSCDIAILNNKPLESFLEVFENYELEETDSIITASEKLKEYLDRFSDANNAHFFLAGFLNDEAYLFDITRQAVKRFRDDQDYGLNWGGEQEVIGKLLLGESPARLNFQYFSLKDAVDMAEFLIDTTIKYQRFREGLASCGGFVDILVITGGRGRFVKDRLTVLEIKNCGICR